MKWLLLLVLATQLYVPAKAVFIEHKSEAAACQKTAGIYKLELTWLMDQLHNEWRTTTGIFKCECFILHAEPSKCFILLE